MCMTINSGFCLPALRQSPGFLVGRKQRKLNILSVFKGLLIMPLELSSVGEKEVKWLHNYRNATLGGPCPCLHVSLSSGLPVFMSPCLPVFRSSCLHVSMTSGPHVFMSLTVSYAWVMLVMLDTVHVVRSTVARCSPGADPDYNSIDHAFQSLRVSVWKHIQRRPFPCSFVQSLPFHSVFKSSFRLFQTCLRLD